MLVAFDFGISNTDIGVFQDNQTTFHTIPSQQESLSPELIKEMLVSFSLPFSEIKCIGVTGGKSSDLPNSIGSIKIDKINEVDAIGFGAKVLYSIEEEPTLVVSTGTGTACVLITGDDFELHNINST